MARPVRQLVQGGPVIVDLPGEGRLRRHADIVQGRDVMGLVAADPEVGPGRGDQGFDVRDHLPLGQGRGLGAQGLQPLALLDVEDCETLEEGHGAGRVAVAGRPFLLGLGGELVGEDHARPALAPPHLTARLLGLAEGQPALGAIAVLDDRAPKQQDVDARIGPPGGGVARQTRPGSPDPPPGLDPRRAARRQLVDDPAGDLVIEADARTLRVGSGLALRSGGRASAPRPGRRRGGGGLGPKLDR